MKRGLLFGALILAFVLAMGAVAFGHHVGDKTIPGQNYMETDWDLDGTVWLDRAHDNAPWENTSDVIEDAIAIRDSQNTRELHLADYFEEPGGIGPNDNKDQHPEPGDGFVHDDLWPTTNGRMTPPSDVSKHEPNTVYNGIPGENKAGGQPVPPVPVD